MSLASWRMPTVLFTLRERETDHCCERRRDRVFAVGVTVAGGDAVGVGEREFYLQGGPRPGRAVEGNPAAECLHAVLESDQSGAVGEVGAAGAVVANREPQDASDCLDADRKSTRL